MKRNKNWLNLDEKVNKHHHFFLINLIKTDLIFDSFSNNVISVQGRLTRLYHNNQISTNLKNLVKSKVDRNLMATLESIWLLCAESSRNWRKHAMGNAVGTLI